MRILQTIILAELKEPMRLNVYCEKHISFFESRKSVKKSISKGAVLLNMKVVHGGTWLKVNDIITLVDLEDRLPKPYELSVPVIFEDDYLAVLNKPSGLTVSGNQHNTLYNALSTNIAPSSQSNALPWPLPVHRLDNPTSGLIIVAKTKTARINLGRQFELKTIQKTYRAIISGKVSESMKVKGTFNTPIEGKEAITNFKIISESRSLKNDWLSLIELYPKTGRTHQLRIHLAQNETPILGDKIYAASTIKHKGLFLCACDLKFLHPISKQNLDISIPIPSKFEKRLKSEDCRWKKYNRSDVL